jgi:para-nitrobenzyl esterase
VFDHLETGARDRDRKLASSMAAYWTNFAKSGNPNGGSLPRWRPVSANGDTALVLGESIEMAALPALEGVRLIDGFYTRLRSAAR